MTSWVVANDGTGETPSRNDPGPIADPYTLVEAHTCPTSTCSAPAGSPCRTGRGKVAAQYHTARFRLVPQLAKALTVPTPPVRMPGAAWIERPRAAGARPRSGGAP
ncbi:zinc finger domain-containing protein [Streptomyces buecherae]|uniref:zinc finger domain-containing protein n=1 Tax=Streptomyces buecherae TaxID=2763006 RepID=UPI003F5405D1